MFWSGEFSPLTTFIPPKGSYSPLTRGTGKAECHYSLILGCNNGAKNGGNTFLNSWRSVGGGKKLPRREEMMNWTSVRCKSSKTKFQHFLGQKIITYFFKKMCHSRLLFLYSRLFNTVNFHYKCLPMTVIEKWTSGIGSDRFYQLIHNHCPILTYFLGGSITIQLTSCYTVLDSTKEVNKFLIEQHFRSWFKTSKVGGQSVILPPTK